MLQVRRFRNDRGAVADMIFNELEDSSEEAIIVDPMDHTRQRRLGGDLEADDLLIPVAREGKLVAPGEDLETIRARAQQQLSLFHSGVRRHANPHQYPVGLEKSLHDLKTNLILKARSRDDLSI